MSEESETRLKCHICNHDLQKDEEITITAPGKVLQVHRHPNEFISHYEIQRSSSEEKYAHKKCPRGYKFSD